MACPGFLKVEYLLGLLQFGGVEFVPVVEVVEVDGVAWVTVGEACGAEDALAGFIGVDVAGDGGVELLDSFCIDLGAIFADPLFTLDVGGFGGDKCEECVAVDAEAVENHLVISCAAAWVAVGNLAGCFEG